MNFIQDISRGTYWLVMLLSLFFGLATAQTGRSEQDLSGEGWSLWLDHGALWVDDEAHLPPVDIRTLPVNPPSGGWEELRQNRTSLKVAVPGTVEEYYWGAIGGVVQDTAGNYVGVSWWSRKFHLDNALKGKRITLAFQSVNLRAEVFVNDRLVGYDVVGNTPFEFDATEAVKFGQENNLDIRITDPVGNFSWEDNMLQRWGKNLVPAVHGFGGITGKVTVRATDPVVVRDIYVQNRPDPKKIKIFTSLDNYSGREQKGTLEVSIHEKGDPTAVLWKKSVPAVVPVSGSTIEMSAHVPRAELWELSEYMQDKSSMLYEALVHFVSEDNTIIDSVSQRFGFRWFNVGERNGDKRFYLNGKRVFLKIAVQRGFWPKNGIFPTKEMADKDMKMLRNFGMNTVYMHRAIAQPRVFDYADAHGFFTYEEPGGYRVAPNPKEGIDGPDEQAVQWRREKLRRMVIRDRSFPSFILYYLKNEAKRAPDNNNVNDMKLVHDLDPSRTVLYNSGSSLSRDANYQKEAADDPNKLHMLPYSKNPITYGWFDQHHWFPYGGYVDEIYNNPKFYMRGVINGPRSLKVLDSLYRLDKKEIIFWGEEGGWGTMLRLQKIKEEIGGQENATGFRELEHLDWYNHYDEFLDQTGFRNAYPNVDSLTMSLGRNKHYFMGRSIENVRLGNIGDAFAFNGWASASTRSDIVDVYRNPTSDPAIISHYTQPLYVAVKIRNKVLSVGAIPIADFFIVNEMNLQGKHTFLMELEDPDGNIVFNKKLNVMITGGEMFGELLAQKVQLPKIIKQGHYTLNAMLSSSGVIKASGYDQIFAVDINKEPVDLSNVAIIENDDILKSFMIKALGNEVSIYDLDMARQDVIIIGNNNYELLGKSVLEDLMNRVKDGTKLIILENADYFSLEIDKVLSNRPSAYMGENIIDWNKRGRYFVGKNKYLKDLPQAQGMGWEYQSLYKVTDTLGRNGMVSGIGLNPFSVETVVALGNQGLKDILISLCSVKMGKGEIILSTLNILPNLSSEESSSIVAKKLFLNLLDY